MYLKAVIEFELHGEVVDSQTYGITEAGKTAASFLLEAGPVFYPSEGVDYVCKLYAGEAEVSEARASQVYDRGSMAGKREYLSSLRGPDEDTFEDGTEAEI